MVKRSAKKKKKKNDKPGKTNTSPGCHPLFKETSILRRHRDQKTRRIEEAAHIAKMGDRRVSMPSVSVSSLEFNYLDVTLKMVSLVSTLTHAVSYFALSLVYVYNFVFSNKNFS